jgi:hypothetical protein
MSIAYSGDDRVVLDSDHFQLVIHATSQTIAGSIEVSDPPKIRENASIKICIPVASIADARETARTLAGMLGAKANEWEADGFRACDGYDPEGNVIQVREAAS